jgi:Protein of unknown function (Hypoth_ymh)
MEEWKLTSIARVVGTLDGLRSLPIPKQAFLLLRRLATQFPEPATFGKMNFQLQAYSRMLTDGFPMMETISARDYLLSTPWQYLVNHGFIRDNGQGFYCVTDDGLNAAKNSDIAAVNMEVLSAIELLAPALHEYAHYFRDNRLKEGVAAAFELYENRLNEIRDSSRNAAIKSTQGRDVVYALFNAKKLKLPYPKLNRARKQAYQQGLTSVLSGALGWIRNAYAHEKHQLPDLNPGEALELLFVASYLLRMLDYSRAKKK